MDILTASSNSSNLTNEPETLPPALKRSRRDIKCEQCAVELSKYTCPKCAFKSCSVVCVKKHKELTSCDGMPQIWKTTPQISHFTPQVSIGDQQFLDQVQQKLGSSNPDKLFLGKSIQQPTQQLVQQPPQIHANEQNGQLDRNEFFLQKSTAFRRICLKIDAENKTEGSRHENYSDTIFWTIRIKFVRSNSTLVTPTTGSALSQLNEYESSSSDDNTSTESPTTQIDSIKEDSSEFIVDTSCSKKATELIECFSFLVRDIPETLTVATLVKQFVRPRTNGPVISRSELDLEKMAPFLNAPDSCLVYLPMKINEDIKYFSVDSSKTILDNLRNRTVNGHPEFVVALSTDGFDFDQPSQEDVQSIRPVFHRQFNNNNNSSFNNRKRQQNRHNQNNNSRGGFNNFQRRPNNYGPNNNRRF